MSGTGRRKQIVRLGAAAALAALAACGTSPSASQAEKLVRAYNEGLVAAYRVNDASPLQRVATERELRKVGVLIDLKKSAKLVLESSIESLEVTSVKDEGAAGLVVDTRERWRYADRSLIPGQPAGTEFVADMRMRYRFLKSEGGWLMDQGETLSCEYLQPRGFHPQAAPAGHAAGGAT